MTQAQLTIFIADKHDIQVFTASTRTLDVTKYRFIEAIDIDPKHHPITHPPSYQALHP